VLDSNVWKLFLKSSQTFFILSILDIEIFTSETHDTPAGIASQARPYSEFKDLSLFKRRTFD
jgi:hypothetical protein